MESDQYYLPKINELSSQVDYLKNLLKQNNIPFHQLSGISEGKEGEGDIEAAVLPGTADLVNQDSRVADGLIVGAEFISLYKKTSN